MSIATPTKQTPNSKAARDMLDAYGSATAETTVLIHWMHAVETIAGTHATGELRARMHRAYQAGEPVWMAADELAFRVREGSKKLVVFVSPIRLAMTHAEFHRAVAEFANGKYYSTKVEVTSQRYGSTEFEYSAYRAAAERGWTPEFQTAEECLAYLAGVPLASPKEDHAETIGDVAAELKVSP